MEHQQSNLAATTVTAPPTSDKGPNAKGSDVLNLLPIIRISGRLPGLTTDKSVQVIGLYSDRVICFRTSSKVKVPAQAYEPDGEGVLRKVSHRGTIVDVSWAEILRIEIQTSIDPAAPILTQTQRKLIRFTLSSGSLFEISLPLNQAERVVQVADELAAGRVFEVEAMPPLAPDSSIILARKKSRADLYWKIYCAVLILPFFVAALLGALPWDGALILAGLLSIFPAFHFLFEYLRKRRNQRPYKIKAPLPPAPIEDLSGWRPYRSRRAGIALKIVGAFALCVGFLGEFMPLAGVPPQLWTFICYLPATCLLYAGYRLCLRSAEDLRVTDKRAPVLYLRSFSLDAKNSLNPRGFLAQALGVQSINHLGPLANVNPVRLIRLLFSRASDHVEEQLADSLNHIGPFVAIGQPGERLALGGAARMYVGNDKWQDEVKRLLKESEIVVLQPADTGHMWFEIEESFKLADRKNLLFLMTAFKEQQSEYEKFRERLQNISGCSIPRTLGDNHFLYFSQNTGKLLPLKFRPPIVWPISGCAIDIDATLAPFLASRAGASSPIDKKQTLLTRFIYSPVPALSVWATFFFGLNLAASYKVEDIKAWNSARTFASKAAVGMPLTTVEGPAEIPYRLELPAYWVEHNDDSVPRPLFFNGKLWTIDKLGLVLTTTEQASYLVPSNSKDYADRVISQLAGPLTSVTDRRTVEANSRSWEVVDLVSKEPGGFLTKTAVDAGVLYQKPSSTTLRLYIYSGEEGALQLRGAILSQFENKFLPLFDRIFERLKFPTVEELALEKESKQIEEMGAAADPGMAYSGHGYTMRLNDKWTKVSPVPPVDAAFSYGESAFIMIVSEELGPYGGISNSQYAQAVMTDIRNRDSSVKIRGEKGVYSNGEVFDCVRFSSFTDNRTIFYTNCMTVRSNGVAFQVSLSSVLRSDSLHDLLASKILELFSFN